MEALAENGFACACIPLHQTKLYLHLWRPSCDVGALQGRGEFANQLLSLI